MADFDPDTEDRVIHVTKWAAPVINLDKTPELIDLEALLEDGPIAYPSTPEMPDEVFLPQEGFYGDYYLRIWVVPPVRRLANPRLNTPYPFDVWNAFPVVNPLQELVFSNLSGVDVEWEIGEIWDEYELKTKAFEITSDAPPELDGYIEFDFTVGFGRHRVIALVVDVLKAQPNEPVQETWNWFTSVSIAYSSKEQRSALRTSPRVMLSYDAMLVDEDDRLRIYRQLFAYIGRAVLLPLFQYTVPLENDAPAGSFDLQFDLSVADVRVGEYILLFHPTLMTYELQEVAVVMSDGVVIENELLEGRGIGWEVIPTRLMRLPDATGIAMGAINGSLSVSGETLTTRALERPGTASVYPSYDGLMAIPDRPVAPDEIEEEFLGGAEVIDVGTSNPGVYSSWPVTLMNFKFQYLLDRDTDMDYWKAILNKAMGRRTSFLVPTFRKDLPLVEDLDLGAATFITSNTDIVDMWNKGGYTYLWIESRLGGIFRKIMGVFENEDGTVTVTMDDGIGGDEGRQYIHRISYAPLVRLNADDISMQHYRHHTILDLPLRIVNA